MAKNSLRVKEITEGEEKGGFVEEEGRLEETKEDGGAAATRGRSPGGEGGYGEGEDGER